MTAAHSNQVETCRTRVSIIMSLNIQVKSIKFKFFEQNSSSPFIGHFFTKRCGNKIVVNLDCQWKRTVSSTFDHSAELPTSSYNKIKCFDD